ncbi:MAG: hypothetical protein ACRC7N_11790, partial [Clostridium sp.]
FRIFSIKESYKKLCLNYNEKVYENKIIEVWNEVLRLGWEKSESGSVEATLEVLSNFSSINSDIVKNIKHILDFIQPNNGVSYKICEYLGRILSEDSIEDIIKVMKCYKSDLYDRNIIELCEKVKALSEVNFKDFKDYWLINNKNSSPLRTYLLNK